MSKQHPVPKPEKSRRRRYLILSMMTIGCAVLLKRDSLWPKK